MSAIIHHVSVFVRDLARSLELFSGILGMDIVQRLDGVKGGRISKLLGIPGFEAEMAFLKHPSQGVCLELVSQVKPGPASQPPGALDGFGISLQVGDLDAVYGRLLKAGWQPISQPMEMSDPAGRPIRLFCFHTEEGLLVELIGKAD